MTSASPIEEITARLGRGVPARSEVILFGSHARGEGDRASDYDILVIEASVSDPSMEAVRLMRLLRGLLVPVDVVVVDREQARIQGHVRGTMVERARREGRVLANS